MDEFIREKIKDLGTSACPPYHLALVIGGTSAEANLAAVKKASAGYFDNLPTSGNMSGQAFRDLEWEKRVHKICQESSIGAQFGGKYFVSGWTGCFVFCGSKHKRENHERRNIFRAIGSKSEAIFARNSTTYGTSGCGRFE
jgi:tartrate dehydratase alpha subunit/fumarate hydratase class I-like protein